jgi:hypothetical protein
VRPPKLGNPCSVVRNDSLNIIVGTSEAMDTGDFQTSGVDFKYHSPYLDVYVHSSQFE